ncbi:IS3 family transposase [Achromobacter insolitus]|uniref:IS3 family transposase n=1 Tax=Achromobacter insolitus TaxID=217204 RepID=UPI0015836D2C
MAVIHGGVSANHLERSISRRGNCWDNAVAESFFGSLKKEHIKKHIYSDRDAATLSLAGHIGDFHNSVRRRSYLGGGSPNEFEAAHSKRKLGVH